MKNMKRNRKSDRQHYTLNLLYWTSYAIVCIQALRLSGSHPHSISQFTHFAWECMRHVQCSLTLASLSAACLCRCLVLGPECSLCNSWTSVNYIVVPYSDIVVPCGTWMYLVVLPSFIVAYRSLPPRSHVLPNPPSHTWPPSAERQVAIVRDEVAEKQRVIDELRSQAIAAQAKRGWISQLSMVEP